LTQPRSYATPLAVQFGQLLKRMWNPRNFKGQVLPIPTQKKQNPELLQNETKTSKRNKSLNS
jgi:hypothetical protein